MRIHRYGSALVALTLAVACGDIVPTGTTPSAAGAWLVRLPALAPQDSLLLMVGDSVGQITAYGYTTQSHLFLLGSGSRTGTRLTVPLYRSGLWRWDTDSLNLDIQGDVLKGRVRVHDISSDVVLSRVPGLTNELVGRWILVAHRVSGTSLPTESTDTLTLTAGATATFVSGASPCSDHFPGIALRNGNDTRVVYMGEKMAASYGTPLCSIIPDTWRLEGDTLVGTTSAFVSLEALYVRRD